MHKVARKSGQGMTEYIIIIAIIAIGAILVVGLFGKQIKGVFSGISGSLAGSQNTQDDTGANQAADNVKRSGMDDYDEQPKGEGFGDGGGGKLIGCPLTASVLH